MYSYNIIYHNFLPNFLKKYILSFFLVMALGSISLASQYRGVLVGLANKIALVRMPAAC
jgi:hypothetical protein